jgi:mannose/fructose-specific phosphotransferase system component IIA
MVSVSTPRAILVTHGAIGAQLLAVARRILGETAGVEVLSNEGLSVEALRQRIEERLRAHAGSPVFLLVDLLGGSCGQVCCLLRAREGERVEVVAGLNLPMLLEFLHKRDVLPPEELAESLVRKAREGIQWLRRVPSS